MTSAPENNPGSNNNGERQIGFIVIISGASGTGKGSVIEEMKSIRNDFVLSISTTTRKPRADGVIGEHYAYVSPDEFKELVSAGAFLEWAEVHGNYYGTRKDWVEEKLNGGWIVLLEIDVQGALQVMQRKIDFTSVFVTPSDRKVAHTRLRERGTESPEEIERRIRNSAWEYQQMNQFEYIVVNDSGKLREAAETLSAILTAECVKMPRIRIRP
ncbi:MAG: guanylate kinase [bacterium]|nr:guanylate kinase [bacterium]